MPRDDAERLIAADECQRAVVGYSFAQAKARGWTKAEHAKHLLAGLIAGRRGRAATRAWMDALEPKQVGLFG